LGAYRIPPETGLLNPSVKRIIINWESGFPTCLEERDLASLQF